MKRGVLLRRAGFAAAALSIGFVGLVPSMGGASGRTPTLNPDTTFTGACTFPVAFHAVVNNEFSTATTLPDGTIVTKTTGNLVATLTNTNNGNSVTLNISGPGVSVVHPDGSSENTLQGRSLFIFFAQAQTAFGLPGLQLGSGLIQADFDSSGNLTSYSHSGSSTDLCAALA